MDAGASSPCVPTLERGDDNWKRQAAMLQRNFFDRITGQTGFQFLSDLFVTRPSAAVVRVLPLSFLHQAQPDLNGVPKVFEYCPASIFPESKTCSGRMSRRCA
ncbi:MAG: hypothetical protein C4576_30695 [Desulfobacteraceae bacterium]|nr:MAG: hypothetical protein C4576_30695 [Desulfobacteraceae bacterium]